VEGRQTTVKKRLFANAAVNADQRGYLAGVYDVDLRIMRPAVDLPSGIGDFHAVASLDASYELGLADAAKGWIPHV
jgi:hypothetical protein